MNTQEIVRQHHEEAVALGHHVFGTFLQGSQNYGLSHAGSDVDTKSLVIPTFRQVCRNSKLVSYTHVRENNEHIDLKDVRLMFQNFLKQNINMVEILFTNHYIVDAEYLQVFLALREKREQIVRYNQGRGINCCAGMAYEKYKAMKHPYPSLIDKIEKYGYDCYTEDTEFLTEHGWLRYDEIAEGTLLATMCHKRHTLEFQGFTSRIKKPASEAYTVETVNSKFSVTKSHNVYTSPIKNINVNGHAYKGQSWKLEPLEEALLKKTHRHLVSFPVNANTDYPVSDTQLCLVGAFVSEGTINFRDKEQTQVKTARIVQTLKGKPEFYTMMDRIPHLNRWDSDKETVWTTSKAVAESLLRDCCHGSQNKKLPSYYLQLSERQAGVLLYSLMLGDGYFSSCRDVYYTSSKQLATEVHTLALLAGKEAVLNGGEAGYPSEGRYGKANMYHVAIKHKGLSPSYVYLKEGKNVKKSSYKGDVVCFEVPNGLLVTKLDGKTAVQGNCKQLHHIARMATFIEDFFILGKSFEKSLKPEGEQQQLLLSLKTEPLPLALAEDIAKNYLAQIESSRTVFADRENTINETIPVFLDDMVEKIFRISFNIKED